MPFSFRLDPATARKIRRLAAASGRTKSAVVREAMDQYEPDRRPADAGEPESAYDRLKAFIGVVRFGDAQYSRNTHTKYRASLAAKHRARRPR